MRGIEREWEQEFKEREREIERDKLRKGSIYEKLTRRIERERKFKGREKEGAKVPKRIMP